MLVENEIFAQLKARASFRQELLGPLPTQQIASGAARAVSHR